MRVLTFKGRPREMGEAFGESCRFEIAELCELRVKNAIQSAKEYGDRNVDTNTLLALARRCLPEVERFAPVSYAELRGIARGANRPHEEIWAMNALTDLRDVLAFGQLDAAAGPAAAKNAAEEGCSSVIVQRDRNADGMALAGQTWDLATDNMPYVVAVQRRPREGPPTTALTTVGCLSLIGMNGDGIAIGTTNLRTRDSECGVAYLDVIHEALCRRSIKNAADLLAFAPRAGAHYFYVLDAHGNAEAIECAAGPCHREDVSRGFFAHCNHALAPEVAALEVSAPLESTVCRQSRVGELLSDLREDVTVTRLKKMFADHEGGASAICRHDVAGISSNASVIMRPATRSLWMVQGQACRGEWLELTAAD